MTALIFLIIIFRVAIFIRYCDFSKVEKLITLQSTSQLIYRSDLWVELLLMLSVWLEIFLFLKLCRPLHWSFSILFSSLLIAGRFRALQEIGHTALHFGFGAHRSWQWSVADLLGNFWIFKPNSKTRYQGHCVEHHPHFNTGLDPNIKRLKRIGFVPGLSRGSFKKYLVYPLTVDGLKETLTNYYLGAGKNHEKIMRLSFLILILGFTFLYYGTWAPVSWVLGLVLFYPLFSWWSLLAEHRWFVQNSTEKITIGHCSEVTTRTAYKGFSGFLVRYFISPCTDSVHLAHHLYPRLHWRYLARIDEHLHSTNPDYGNFVATSFFGTGENSIVGDLRKRMSFKGEGENV